MCTTAMKYISTYANLLRKTDIAEELKLSYVERMSEYKYSAGVFQSDFNAILINLEPHGNRYRFMQNEDDFLELIKQTIVHESLHWLFFNLEGIWRPSDYIESIVEEMSKY